MKDKKLTQKKNDRFLKKKRTKKLTKLESKKLENELDRRYNMCINKLSKEYSDNEKYAICNYSAYRRKYIKKKNIRN